jgi:hypothetical protein
MKISINKILLFIILLLNISDTSLADVRKKVRGSAPKLGPYIKSNNDPIWHPEDDENPGRWLGGIAGNKRDPIIEGSDQVDDSYYPWGYTAPYHRKGKLCISNQFATNEMGQFVLYEKIRPLIYCNYR